MYKSNTLARNGIYNLAGGVIKILTSIAAIPIVIRYLGVEEYGLWALISSFVSIFALLEAGFSTAVTVFTSHALESTDNNELSITLSTSLLLMLLLSGITAFSLYFCSYSIVNFYSDVSLSFSLKILYGLQLGSWIVWGRFIQQSLVGIEQAYNRYDISNLANTALAIVGSVGTIAVVVFGGKTIQILLFQAALSFVSAFLHCLIVSRLTRGLKVKWKLNPLKAKSLIRYSSMMWVATIGALMFSKIDRLAVGSLLGMKQLGTYSAIVDVASQINGIAGMAVHPLIASVSSQASKAKILFHSQIKKAFIINSYVSLVFGTITIVLAPILLSFVFKTKVNNHYLLDFEIAIVVYSLCSVNFTGYYTLLGLDNVKACSIIALLSGLSSLIFTCLGASIFGLSGAILGNLGIMLVYAYTIFAMKVIELPISKYFDVLFYPSASFIISSFLIILLPMTTAMQSVVSILSFLFISIVLISSYNNTKFLSLNS
jgi:O-antigen/teichoic acid export membrane protein